MSVSLKNEHPTTHLRSSFTQINLIVLNVALFQFNHTLRVNLKTPLQIHLGKIKFILCL